MKQRLNPAPRPIDPKAQRGMGFLSVFAIIAASVFIGMFAIKVGPQYFEYWTVKKVADDLAKNSELLKGPRSKVNQYIQQAYRTNNLWDLKAEDTIHLKRDKKNGYVVTVNYEKRANLIHNIDLVTVFDSQAGS